MSSVRILLADDHQIFREALRALLQVEGFQVVAEASDGPEAVGYARELRPDVAILDFALPLTNGIDAVDEIRRASPNTRMLLLTEYADGLRVRHALDSGINGYVLKSQPRVDLLRAIDTVVNGGRYLSPDISQAVVEAYLGKGRREGALTVRERQVLQLIADGKSTKEVAGVLGVSFKTAESHRTRIMQKLSVHNSAGLVRFAIGCGLLQP